MAARSFAGTSPEPRAGLAARRRPPGPKGLPFLGNLLDFGRDVLRYYAEWSRDYGDIVALRLAGWPAVLINRPDYAEYVLVRNPQNFIKFPFFFRHVRAIFGQGLLTSEGEFWHRQRRLAAPAFHSQRLASYGDATVRYTERMLENWQPGELRDVHADTMALTLRIAAKVLFDAEVERDVADIGRAISTVVEEIAVRFRRPFAIPDAIPIPGNVRYVRGVRRIDQLVTKIIRERREQGEDRGDERGTAAGRGDHAPARRPRNHGARALLDVVSARPALRRGHEARSGVAGRPGWTGADGRRLAATALHRASGDRGHAPLSTRVGLRPRGARRLRDRRLRHSGRHHDHHQPLGVAP
jgi:hypothetical protein